MRTTVGLVLALLVATASAAPDDFMAQVESEGRVLEPLKKRCDALLEDGRVDEANKVLLDVVPEDKRTPALDFALANMLFSMDPKISRRLHERVFRAAPKAPPAQLEFAVEEHRAGEYATAEKAYAGVADAPGAGHPKLHALRADCLLHLGRPWDALEEWNAAKPSKYHSEIEEAFCWVYGPLSPYARRAPLLADARAGKPGAAEDLIRLDATWDRDWWNHGPKKEILERDLKLLEEKLGKDSARFQDLAFYAAYCRPRTMDEVVKDEDKARPGARREEAERLGLLGDKPRLPESSRIAGDVFAKLRDDGAIDAKWILARHEEALWTRASSEEGDLDALEILAACYAATESPRLAEVDRLGWERRHDPRFAGSLLAAKGDALKSDDPLLVEALARCPDYANIARSYGVALQREGKPMEDAISRVLRAEFKTLASWQSVRPVWGLLAQQKKPAPAPK